MPLPSPKGRQPEDSFVSNCMSDDKMKKEFPNQKQRFAVCKSQYKRAKKSKAKWQDWNESENGDFILY